MAYLRPLHEIDLYGPAETFEERMARKREREEHEPPKQPESAVTEVGYRWRKPEEANNILIMTRVLIKLTKDFIIAGIIYEDGVLGIYDVVANKYIDSGWKGVEGWIPTSELLKWP